MLARPSANQGSKEDMLFDAAHTISHGDQSFTTSSMLYSLLWQIWENSMWPSYRLDLSLLSQHTVLSIETSLL